MEQGLDDSYVSWRQVRGAKPKGVPWQWQPTRVSRAQILWSHGHSAAACWVWVPQHHLASQIQPHSQHTSHCRLSMMRW